MIRGRGTLAVGKRRVVCFNPLWASSIFWLSGAPQRSTGRQDFALSAVRRDMKVAQGVSPGYVYKRGEPRRGGTKIHVACVAPLGLAFLTPRTQALRPGLPLFRALRALRSSWVTNPTSISKYKPGETGRSAMVFNYQSQITNHKLPITNYQSQITNHKLQILASHQFLCPLRGLDHGVHQCHAQPATLELHQAFDGAAGRRGDCVFEQRGMMTGL